MRLKPWVFHSLNENVCPSKGVGGRLLWLLFPFFRPGKEISGSCLLGSECSFSDLFHRRANTQGNDDMTEITGCCKSTQSLFLRLFLFLVPLSCAICPASWNQKGILFGFPPRFEHALLQEGYVFIIFTLIMNESVLDVFSHNWPSARYGSGEWADKE